MAALANCGAKPNKQRSGLNARAPHQRFAPPLAHPPRARWRKGRAQNNA
jgi:hypothetical protein